MASPVDPDSVTKLNEHHQEVYGKDIENLVPDVCQFIKEVPFKAGKKTNKNLQPVILSDEHGFSTGTEVFKYKPSVGGERKKAAVSGQTIVLTSSLSIEDANLSTEHKSQYEGNAGSIVESMGSSMQKRLEIMCLYGRDGLGTIESVVKNGKTAEITFTPYFAPTMFAGAEKLPLDVYDSDGELANTDDMPIVITKVDTKNRKIEVKSKEELTFLAQGQVVHFFGFRDFEMQGMKSILSSTGNLFGISGSEFSTWNGNSYAVGNQPLRMHTILDALIEPINKGLEEDVCIFTNPIHWNQVNDDLKDLRRVDASYNVNVVKVGSKNIEFHGNSGIIKLVPSVYMKIGDAFVFSPKRFKRSGNMAPTFSIAGTDIGNVWNRMEHGHGVYSRLWTDQYVFTSRPGISAYISGISADPITSNSIVSPTANRSALTTLSNKVKTQDETIVSLNSTVKELNLSLKAQSETISAMEKKITALEQR